MEPPGTLIHIPSRDYLQVDPIERCRSQSARVPDLRMLLKGNKGHLQRLNSAVYRSNEFRHMPNPSIRKEIQLVVVGGGGVGKSAMTVRYCRNAFLEEYDPTIEDCFTKHIFLDNEPMRLTILDTAGQEEYGALRDQWYRSGDGFLFVFNITDRESIDQLLPMFEGVLEAKQQNNIPCVLVANKCDLAEQREVSLIEARQLAKRLRCPLIEASAKTGVNVDLAFQQCGKHVLRESKTLAEEV